MLWGQCADKHREYAGDENEAQQYILALLAERLEQCACQQYVKTRLGGCNSKNETAKEEYDDWVGKCGHERTMVEQFVLVYSRSEEVESVVGCSKKQQADKRN